MALSPAVLFLRQAENNFREKTSTARRMKRRCGLPPARHPSRPMSKRSISQRSLKKKAGNGRVGKVFLLGLLSFRKSGRVFSRAASRSGGFFPALTRPFLK